DRRAARVVPRLRRRPLPRAAGGGARPRRRGRPRGQRRRHRAVADPAVRAGTGPGLAGAERRAGTPRRRPHRAAQGQEGRPVLPGRAGRVRARRRVPPAAGRRGGGVRHRAARRRRDPALVPALPRPLRPPRRLRELRPGRAAVLLRRDAERRAGGGGARRAADRVGRRRPRGRRRRRDRLHVPRRGRPRLPGGDRPGGAGGRRGAGEARRGGSRTHPARLHPGGRDRRVPRRPRRGARLRLVIVCYARGDGLGHLTRLRSVLHTLGADGPVTVVTGSPFAGDPRVTGGWRVVRTAGPVRGADLAALAPDEVIVDAFPAGLRGELTGLPPGVRTTHLARLLRWDAYAPMLPADPPRFDRTYLLEPLAPAHEAYLRAVSGEILPLALTDPPSDPIDVDGWLIVHSGPDAETLELVAYAQDMASAERINPPMTLVSPQKPEGLPPGVAYLDAYP